jgi:hypothetical protein
MTMMTTSRRQFLTQVGQGMLIASVGPTMAANLGASPAFAGEGSDALTFGSREPLVTLLQETPADKLLPILVGKLNGGLDLRELVAAAALANARTFGGHNYDGYHAFMALAPAYQMAQEMPTDRKALPVLKVLHRNTRFMQAVGGHAHEALHAVEPAKLPGGKIDADKLRQATREADAASAEKILAAISQGSLEDAYNQLQLCIQDDIDVHRVVLSWRSWATLDLTGRDAALTLLRQSVQFCVDSEKQRLSNNRGEPGVRSTLPKLLDQYKLLGRSAGERRADDAWIDKLCQTVYEANRDQAAEAAAAALADGFSPADVAEAIALAANRLVLRDPGRTRADTGKPVGSIHGASVGVHASDSANAWRNIAKVVDRRNAVASLIVAAYHTAGQAGQASQPPYPWAEHLDAVKAKDAAGLLAEAEDAIKNRDQIRASAAVHRYGQSGFDSAPVFQMLLRFATSEDGALHAEKYYRTVSEEFAMTRPAFRWRQLVALARVTASEYGFPAPGYAQACELLKV